MMTRKCTSSRSVKDRGEGSHIESCYLSEVNLKNRDALATQNPLIAAYTYDRVIASCSIDAAASRIRFLVNDTFVFETKFNDAEIAPGQARRRFVFGQRTATANRTKP